MATLPPKLYFRIGEVSSLVGVEPHVLRYWEREFRSIRPTKSAKGQRVYSRRDVENLMRVRDLLYADGFTIAGAKKKLQRSGSEPDSAPAVDAIAPEAATAPTPPPPKAEALADVASEGRHVHARAALKELRSEIEAFLAELSG
jgi:DNA-binding transcriptional MerR regulator